MIGVLFSSIVLLALVVVPLWRCRSSWRFEASRWPAYVAREHVRVDVGDGAFRRGAAGYEQGRTVAAGVPWSLKLVGFASMFVAQVCPMLAIYALFLGIASVIFAADRAWLGAAGAAGAAFGLMVWSWTARLAWTATVASYEGDDDRARSGLATVTKGYGAVAAIAVSLLSAMVWLDRAHGAGWPFAAVMSAPFFALVSLAALHQALYERHRPKLLAGLAARSDTSMVRVAHDGTASDRSSDEHPRDDASLSEGRARRG